jgi:hypothetical protein
MSKPFIAYEHENTPMGALAYYGYEILVGMTWYRVNAFEPILPQLRGMRAYRMVDCFDRVVKESTINPSYE